MNACAPYTTRRTAESFKPAWTARFAGIVSPVACLFLAVAASSFLGAAGQAMAKSENANPDSQGVPTSLIDEFAAPMAKGGNGNQSCTIMIGGTGQLAASIDHTAMSSTLMGGQPGSAVIDTTNGSYSLTYDLPASFGIMPSAMSAPVTFSGTFSANGATNAMAQPAGTPLKLKKGSTNVNVDLTASAVGSTFASGAYTATAVLRCE